MRPFRSTWPPCRRGRRRRHGFFGFNYVQKTQFARAAEQVQGVARANRQGPTILRRCSVMSAGGRASVVKINVRRREPCPRQGCGGLRNRRSQGSASKVFPDRDGDGEQDVPI